MKILRQSKRRVWWEGKVGTCKSCKTEVQLEAGDDVRGSADGVSALVSCPNCIDDIVVGPDSPGALEHECEWKERARKHGCDVENGDPDCG